jgi:hypothetical protein
MVPSFLIIVEFHFKDIREKENFQNEEQDKKLDQNNYPQLFANGHTPETVVIKIKYFMRNRPVQ